MSREKTYIAWLNDAHAMEQNLIQVLQNHSRDAEAHPQLQTKIEAHLEETRRHAEMIRACIERRGGAVSKVKSGIGTVMGTFQGLSTEMFQDELVKNALADMASEYFEIASYTSLMAAAEQLGDSETAQACQEILKDERAMAQFLEEQIPLITARHLAGLAGTS
jgi:ferritin-like metal-binding protein YciE